MCYSIMEIFLKFSSLILCTHFINQLVVGHDHLKYHCLLWLQKNRETKLELTWKFPLCWLPFIVPDGGMQGIVREKASTVFLQLPLNATILTYQETGVLRYNGGVEAMRVKILDWMWGLLHQREFVTITINLGKCPMVQEVMDSR